MATTTATVRDITYRDLEIFVRWDPATDSSVTGYQIIASTPASGTVLTSADYGVGSRSGQITLTEPLDTTLVYSVQVQSLTAGGPGDASPAIPILSAQPWLSAADYDGARIRFAWSIAVPPAGGYRLQATSADSGQTVSIDIADPFATEGTLPTTEALSPGMNWQLRVSARGQSGVAAWSQPGNLPNPLTEPTVSVIEYQSQDRLVLRWSAAGGDVARYEIELDTPQTGAIATLGAGGAAARSATVPLAAPLPAYTTPTARLVGRNAAGVGTSSPAIPIIASPATMIGASYDGAAVRLVWTPSSDQTVTDYGWRIVSPASGTSSNGAATPTGASAATGPLAADGAWEAMAVASRQDAAAAVSVPLQLLTAQAVVTSLVYDGETVAVAWTGVADPRVVGYTAVVRSDAGVVAAAALDDPTRAEAVVPLTAPLAAGQTYHLTIEARARTDDGRLVSSISTPVAIDLGLPTVGTIVYAGGKIAVTWTRASQDAILGYRVALTGRSGASYATDVSDPAATSAEIPVPSLGTAEGWTLTVRTKTASGVSASSAPAGVVATIPTLTDIAYSGAALTATWAAEPDPVFGLASFVLSTRVGDAAPDHQIAITDPAARSGSLTVSGLVADTVAQIAAVAPSGAVTIGAPIPVIVGTATPASVGYDGRAVSASWDSVVGASGYTLSILDATGRAVATGTFAGTAGRLAVDLDPASAFDARLAATADRSAGPAGSSAPVIVGVAVPTLLDTGADTLAVTWQAPDQTHGVTAYVARLYQNGVVQPVQPTYGTLTASFATTLATGAAYAVTIQATGANGATGPESAPVAALVDAPAAIVAVLDGPTLRAGWSAPAASGITGYHAVLTQQSETPLAVDTAATTLDRPVTLASAATPSFTVRAIAGPALGRASTAQAVGGQGFQYFVNPAQSTVQPYLYRSLAATPPQTPAGAIALYVPAIFATEPTLPITSGAFSLTAAEQGSAYPYVMRFDAASAVWTFSNVAIRSQLAVDFGAFLIAIENAGAGEGAIALLREIVALGLPLTYAETLYYRYSFEPAQGFCNLDPGMGFALDGQVFQFEGTSPSSTQLNGFVSGGGRVGSVGTYFGATGRHLTGFDAFLSTLTSMTVPSNTRGAGGVVDLYATGFRRKYWRLFFPATLSGADSFGSASYNGNMAVLGCSSWADLEAATTVYLQTGSFATVSADIATTFFRGRTIATPLITVGVDGTRRPVPVGTTLRDVAAETAALPLAGGLGIAGLGLRRATGNLVNWPAPTALVAAGETNPVAVAAAPFTPVTSQPDVLDIPLLGGDRVVLG